MTETSSEATLRVVIRAEKHRIEVGRRPMYHATWRTTPDGPPTVDVMVRELPLIHLFVPDYAEISDGARVLIARTLAVDPRSFDVAVEEAPRSS